MSQVFIFAGTTEGRKLFELLKKNHISCTISVATDYGADLLTGNSKCKILSGRMNKKQMCSAIKKSKCSCVIDATHPFAKEVTTQIKLVCDEIGIEYLRLKRDTDEEDKIRDAVLFFDSIKSAADYAKDKPGNIFVTTGTKDLNVITDTIQETCRIFVRVLPTRESLVKCEQCGIIAKNIVAMQGPFSVLMNEAILRETKAKFIITKESGPAGGFEEKILASQKCGTVILAIKNPEGGKETNSKENFLYSEAVCRLEKILNRKISFSTPKIILAGIGPGGENLVTKEIFDAIQNADVIFGANTLLEQALFSGKKKINSYLFSDVNDYLQNHPECENPVVVFSGDTGFYSGASNFVKDMKGQYSYSILPGISSVNYLSSKIASPWQDWKLLSMHGKSCNVESFVKINQRCFVITSGKKDFKDLVKRLLAAYKNKSLPKVKITLAFNLSKKDESIISVNIDDYRKIKELLEFEKEGLYSVFIEHSFPQSIKFTAGIKDDSFCRNNIPMTKRDVRLIVLNRLSLCENSIVYDIGCGTGSVTVESALIAKTGHVYAMDMKAEAVELTKKNVAKFGISNATIIHKKAPEGFDELPKPNCVFIGGSSGNIKDIIQSLLHLNPNVRIVLTCVTLETLCMTKQLLDLFSINDIEFTQISISHSEKLGKYNFVKAENPVWVISFTGKENGGEQ